MNDTIPALGQLIEPAPVKFSFGTPGWYFVGGILLVLVFVAVFLLWQHYRKNRYRRDALHWLQREEQRLTTTRDYTQLVYVTNMLIKRIVMQRYGREMTSLRSTDWLNFINKTWHSSFNTDDIQLLDHLYVSTDVISVEKVLTFVTKTKHWIKTHRYEL